MATTPSCIDDLSELVLLEIFSNLSCEEALCAFADLSVFLNRLLDEVGAFRQIHLSASLSMHRWTVLRKIWQWEKVQLLVVRGIFNDCVTRLVQWPLRSLTCLRLTEMVTPTGALTDFIIAHASTLSCLMITVSKSASAIAYVDIILHMVLPHLNHLTRLNFGWDQVIYVRWAELPVMSSLLHLTATLQQPSDMNVLASRFPRLRTLYVLFCVQSEESVLPSSEFQLVELETFVYRALTGTTSWPVFEALMSRKSMPRLRRCSFECALATGEDLNLVRHSSYLNNDDGRNVRVQYILRYKSPNKDPLESIVITKRADEVHLQWTDREYECLRHLWYNQSWPAYIRYRVQSASARHIICTRGVSIDCETSVNVLADRFPRVREIHVNRWALLSFDPSRLISPMTTVTSLFFNYRQVEGSEHLLSILPNLRVIRSSMITLFVALVRRSDIVKVLNGVELLEILDKDVLAYSLKHWYTVLGAFSQLRSLTIVTPGLACPPLPVADFLRDYLLNGNHRLTLLRFFVSAEHDGLDDHAELVDYLQHGLHRSPPLSILQPIKTALEILF